jgi:hypothetical protein
MRELWRELNLAAVDLVVAAHERLLSSGVPKLTLSTRSYRWEFIRPGGAAADVGDDVCR